jgi:hypothetical protein
MSVSFFDKNVHITKDQSATTLCCAIGRGSRNSSHAQIWIEQINENDELKRYFMHLRGPKFTEHTRDENFNGYSCKLGMSTQGVVEVRDDRHFENVKFSGKSETWLREANKVEQMVELARREQNDPHSIPKAFSIFGSKSVFSTKVGAYKTDDESVKFLINAHKSLFKTLFRAAHETANKLGAKALSDFNVVPVGGLLWGANSYNIVDRAIKIAQIETEYFWEGSYDGEVTTNYLSWESLLGKGSISSLASSLKMCKSIEEAQQCVKRIDLQGFERIVLSRLLEQVEKVEKKVEKIYAKISKHLDFPKDLVKGNETFFSYYKKLVRRLYKNCEKTSLIPDNCFTWARDKLELIDVELGSKPSDKWCANTRKYLN